MASQRKVLITGVGRGLGRAMTRLFVDLGHVVAGCARSPEAIAELQTCHRTPHRFDAVDVSDARQVAAWCGDVLSTFGVPDLLVNNAALINENATLWEVPVAEFSRVIDVNIKGVYHVIRYCVPAMVERAHGIIVNFSSTWGRCTSPQVAPYCATKWAIEGLTKALASELPAGMAAVAVNPGVIHTDMLETCFGDGAAAFAKPEAWARSAVPFLLNLGPDDNGLSTTVPE